MPRPVPADERVQRGFGRDDAGALVRGAEPEHAASAISRRCRRIVSNSAWASVTTATSTAPVANGFWGAPDMRSSVSRRLEDNETSAYESGNAAWKPSSAARSGPSATRTTAAPVASGAIRSRPTGDTMAPLPTLGSKPSVTIVVPTTLSDRGGTPATSDPDGDLAADVDARTPQGNRAERDRAAEMTPQQ